MVCKCDPTVACWNDVGDAFIVKDPKKLEKMYIPRYFDHSNFSSFARQLNFYKFRKINNVLDDFTSSHIRFHHEYFCRERPELLSKIKRSTLGGNSKLVNKEIEALKITVSNLEDKISKMSSDFEAKMREMRQCICSCGATNELVTQHKETPRNEVKSSPDSTHPPELQLTKRRKLEDNNYSSDITKISIPKETNFEKRQCAQSDFLVTLINDDAFDPWGDYLDMPLSSHETDQSLCFQDRRSSTASNTLLPLPASLSRPEIGIIRFLSDLSVS